VSKKVPLWGQEGATSRNEKRADHGDQLSSITQFYGSNFLLLAGFFWCWETPNDLVQGPDKHARQDQRDQHLLTAWIGEISVRPGQLTSSDQVCRARKGDHAKDDSGQVWPAMGGLGLITALHQAHMLRIQLLWQSRNTFTNAG
jgi:hypothetical protein